MRLRAVCSSFSSAVVSMFSGGSLANFKHAYCTYMSECVDAAPVKSLKAVGLHIIGFIYRPIANNINFPVSGRSLRIPTCNIIL